MDLALGDVNIVCLTLGCRSVIDPPYVAVCHRPCSRQLWPRSTIGIVPRHGPPLALLWTRVCHQLYCIKDFVGGICYVDLLPVLLITMLIGSSYMFQPAGPGSKPRIHGNSSHRRPLLAAIQHQALSWNSPGARPILITTATSWLISSPGPGSLAMWTQARLSRPGTSLGLPRCC